MSCSHGREHVGSLCMLFFSTSRSNWWAWRMGCVRGCRSSKGYTPQMRLKGCLFRTLGWGCCLGNLSWLWHLWALGRSLASAWEAHRCPGPSSCLLCQIKSGLLFSPFSPSPQQTRQSPLPFSLLRLLFPPVAFFFLLGLWSVIGFAAEWQRQEVLWGTEGASGPEAGARAVHRALCLPGPASFLARLGPAFTEPGFQPWLSSLSFCQAGPVTTASTHWSKGRRESFTSKLRLHLTPGTM